MSIDYQTLKSWPFPDIVQSYSTRDTMLYALSLGLGSNPLDERTLLFVYEGANGAPSVIPTMAVVLGFPGFWMKDPASGIDWLKIVHGENGLVLHRPLPPEGTVVGRTRVTRIVDKGAGKGAVVTAERTISDQATGELYATIRHVSFCRGDGGFSANGQSSDEPVPPLQATPDSPPHFVDDQPTRPDIALQYRLHADRNPLHADPEVAAAAGFPRPVLHGLATYGLAAVAILRSCCDFDSARLKSIETRFSAVVYPGETVRTEMWRQGGTVKFRCRVVERDAVVLSHGLAEIA
jgi:acyl dehydratase